MLIIIIYRCWYSLPKSENQKLDDFVKKHMPYGFITCNNYMRHKTIMISPYLLKSYIPDIKIHK